MDEIILYCKNFIGAFIEENTWCGVLGVIIGIIVLIMVFVDIGKVLLTLGCGVFVYMIYDCINMQRINSDIVIFGIILVIAIFVILIIVSRHEDYYGCGLMDTFIECLIGGVIDIVIALLIGTLLIIPLIIFIGIKEDSY